MDIRYETKLMMLAALTAILTLAVACELDRGPAGETDSINTAGLSAGDAAMLGLAQGARQRGTLGKDFHRTRSGHTESGCRSKGATVPEALEEAAKAMSTVMDSLRAEGVEDRDIQTSPFWITDEREWQKTSENGVRKSKSVLVGYRVSNYLTVKVRIIDRVSVAIDGSAAAGGDSIRFNGLNFTAEDLSPVMAQLREEAVDDAKDKAQHFADLAEVGLGRLIFISD